MCIFVYLFIVCTYNKYLIEHTQHSHLVTVACRYRFDVHIVIVLVHMIGMLGILVMFTVKAKNNMSNTLGETAENTLSSCQKENSRHDLLMTFFGAILYLPW
uniref:Uncharacterized protein n=1 Tax=Cacopsylla melanoneura TaxID=428564 RepID=A0A8D8ZAA3_9HEMI